MRVEKTLARSLVCISVLFLVACGSSEKKQETSSGEPELTLDDFGSREAGGEGPSEELSLPEEGDAAMDSPRTESLSLNAEEVKELRTVKSTQSSGEATRAIANVLAANPDNVIALNALSMHYYKLGRLGMAKTVLDRAFKNDNKNSSLYNSLGVIRLREGELKEAILAFSEALKINPSNFYAAKNLGAIYAEYHDYGKALPLLRSAFKAFPKDESVANNYAVSLRATGKPDLAKKIYQAWDGKMKEAVSLYNYAALLLNDIRDPREALVIIQKISKAQLSASLVARLKVMEQQARLGAK